MDWKFSMSKAFWHREDLSVTAKGIFALLASYADSKGGCHPAKATICKGLGISHNTLERHLKVLKKNGLISWENFRDQNGQMRNQYTILGLWVCKPSKVQPTTQNLVGGHIPKSGRETLTIKQGTGADRKRSRISGGFNCTVTKMEQNPW
jgi:DNA-binding transcriptional ArsR family regulator